MMIAVLLRPRRLPRRYNRPISSQTRAILRGRRENQRRYTFERWKRSLLRLQRKFSGMRRQLGRAFLFGLLGCIPILIIVIIFSPVLRLQKISVDRGNPRVNVEQVVRTLSPLFGKRLFFLSAKEVIPLLQEQIPDLASVDVSKTYPDSLELKIGFDPLVARLDIVEPGGAAAATGSTLADYLTSEGVYVTYAPAQVGTGTALPLIRLVDWGVRPVVGTFPFDRQILTVLPDAAKAISEQFGQPVLERTVYVRAREFHLKTKEYELWFDLRSPLQQQLERYRLFLQAMGKGAAARYVDLRLADRVVYR